jgi:putative copper resistance protein D
MTPVAAIVATAALDLAIALIVGAAATLAMEGDLGSRTSPRGIAVVRLFRVACVLGLCASFALAWMRAIDMTELAPWAALAQVPTMLRETHFGRAWSLAFTMWVVLAALAWWRPPPDRRRLARALAVCAVLAVARASAGHAGGSGDWGPLLVGGAHLFAIGLWSGCVFVAAMDFRRGSASSDPPSSAFVALRARCYARLSSLATVALAVVVATGLAQAWRALGGWEPLVSSGYGRLLDVKLVLVAMAVALGGINRFVYLRRLVAAASSVREGLRALRGFEVVLRIEALVLFAALVVAAALANSEPPAV